ncbi:hypothetical protein DM02DRAFT_625404 [Periconia macrospinosa]|uniref:F-box domain-containing protein n=1 Tax=Periconia macrospinosa TaxID=97972 RepID=A0A2V1E0Q8_9PLEO|nr:hypothetical protein DM02DRAFT_625404 [Periconia macrospinosa]
MLGLQQWQCISAELCLKTNTFPAFDFLHLCETIPPTIIMALMELPGELFEQILGFLDMRSLARLSAVNKQAAAIAERRLWKSVTMIVGNPGHISTDTQSQIHRKLNTHTSSLALSVSEDYIAQHFFRKLIQSVQSKPITTLRLKNSYLENRSYRELRNALIGIWSSTLTEMDLPLQMMDDSGKSLMEPLDSSVTITMKKESGTITIRAMGCQRQGSTVTRGNGAPLRVLKDLIRCIQTGDSGENVEFKGNQSCTSCIGNSIDSLAVPSLASPIKISALSMIGFDFAALSLTNFHRVDTSSIQRLYIRDCSNLDRLFEIFIRSPSPTNLKSFQCEMWHLGESPWYTHQYGVEAFLLSFSGLEDLTINVGSEWELTLGDIARTHPYLRKLVYSSGEIDFTQAKFAEIVETLPYLEHFGFRWSALEKVLMKGPWDRETRRKLNALAKNLAGFWCLEKIMIVCNPVPGKRFDDRNHETRSIRFVADEIHASMSDTRVTRVKLWVRRSRYRLGMEMQTNAPLPFSFNYT